jgi:RNA polymerase sigma-70 factor (ECF subfamily)
VATDVDLKQRTDEQLAEEAAREGSDGPAFAELMRRLREPIWRLCYRLMGNEHDAADAAQEVFVRLFLNRAKFAGRSRYATWAHGIAVRTCLTIRRGRGRRQRRVATASDEMIDQNTNAQPGSPETQLDLAVMLAELDEDDRALLILKYAEDYSYDELAAMFDLSVSACKMRVSRAREKLQQRFPGAV